MRNRAFQFCILIILFIHPIYAQKSHQLEFFAGLSRNTDLNLYSLFGDVIPLVTKGKTFPQFGINYRVEKNTRAVNTFTLATHITGHILSLNKQQFPDHKFNFKSYYSSLLLGYCREWPVSKLMGIKNDHPNLYFGVGLNLNFMITNKFPYNADSARSKDGKWLYTTPLQNRIVPGPNVTINSNLQLRYKIKNKSGKESGSIVTQFMRAFGKTYGVNYTYKFDGISDDIVLANRGHLVNFIVTIPLRKK